MKDNNEGGSRDAASAHRQPAQTTAAAPSDGGRRGLAAAEPAKLFSGASDAAETDDDAGLRPVSADMQQFIGRQLRAVFDDVAKQPVPDRFLELMKQLDSKMEGR